MDGILKTSDRCPCCGQPILTEDPEKLMLLSWIAWMKGEDRLEPDNVG